MKETEPAKQPQLPETAKQPHPPKRRRKTIKPIRSALPDNSQKQGQVLLPKVDRLTTDFSAVLDEDVGYLPPTKEDYQNVQSVSLVTDGSTEAASALLMGVLASLAETQLGLGIGHYILMQAVIFGVLKESMLRQLSGQYNRAQGEFAQRRADQQPGYQVEESQPIERLPHDSMLNLAKSIVGPFLAYEVIQNFPEIMSWAGENPLFVLSIVGILVGVANRHKITNSLLNAYHGLKNGFTNVAHNFVDYVASVRLQNPAYEVQSPIVFQKPVELQSPIRAVKNPIKETRPWFKFRWPFYSKRNRENDQEKVGVTPQT